MSRVLYTLAGLLLLVSIASCKKDGVAASPEVSFKLDINNVVELHPAIQKPYSIAVDYDILGYYAAVPYNYDLTTKSYPLIVFIPGGGQYGNGSTDLPVLLNDGMAQLLDEGTFPPSVTVDGKTFSFIVLTPQLTQYPSIQSLDNFITYAKKNYRVDTSRIYLAGLSIGGELIGEVAGYYPSQIAAIVPMSGEATGLDVCASIANNKIAVWDFHNSNDPAISIVESDNFIIRINNNNPAIPPRRTIFQAAVHDSWTAAINPNYKENSMNIYQWMLQYSK